MEEKDKVKYQELKERTGKVLFDNVKGQIDVSKHRQLIVDIVDTVGKDVEKITDNSTDMNQKFEEYKESQSKLNVKQDIGINKNLQNINQLNEMIKLLSQKDEPIMTANGGSIISLPNNVMKSVTPSYKIEGLTLTNLVKNGDFRDGLNNWSLYSSKIAINENDGSMSNTAEGSNVSGFSIHFFARKIPANSICYFNSIFKIDNDLTTSINYRLSNGTIMKSISNAKKGIQEKVSFVYKYDTVGLSNIEITHQYRTKEDAKGKVMSIYYLYGINLTETFGAGNEPTKEWCDEHIQGYFEGTKSVTAPLRIKSVGANTYDFKSMFLRSYPEYIQVVDGRLCYVKSAAVLKLFSLSGNGYTKLIYTSKNSVNAGIRLRIAYKDGSFSGNYSISTEWNTTIVDLDASKDVDYLQLYYGSNGVGYFDIESIALIRGVDEYIPYTESNLYLNNNLELKSVGEVKDYIENGKLYRNIGYVDDLSKIKVDGFDTNRNTDINVLNLNIKIMGGILESSKVLLPTGMSQSIFNIEKATSEDIGKICTSHYYNYDVFSYYVSKDTTKDQAIKQLEGKWMKYQLRTPEVINLSTTGSLTNHPNGTIFIEPITNVTLLYNDGLDVSKFNIESVEEFAIFKDGNYQSLDVSKIKITDNKLTHPDAVNGLCYLVYRYDNNPIFGDNEVEYYNNDGILVSPDGTFWKPVLTVDDEGNVLMKGEKL